MVALSDGALALVVAAAALVPAIGIARGWNAEGRTADTRFAWLTGTGAALAALGLGLLELGSASRRGKRVSVLVTYGGRRISKKKRQEVQNKHERLITAKRQR